MRAYNRSRVQVLFSLHGSRGSRVKRESRGVARATHTHIHNFHWFSHGLHTLVSYLTYPFVCSIAVIAIQQDTHTTTTTANKQKNTY